MLAIFVVLARLLGPEPFGFAALAMTAPSILAAPVTKGIPDAIIQRPDLEPIHLDSSFWLLTACGIALTAITWISSPLIAAAFGEPLLEQLVRWTSIVILLQAVAAVPAAVLKRQLNFRLFTLRTLVGNLAGGLTGVGMALNGFGVWSLVGMQLVRSAVEAAVLLIGSAWRPRLRYSHSRCRELFGFAGPIMVHALWNFVNEEMPKVFIGAFLGPLAVGVYALARRCLDFLIEIFVAPLNAVAMPAVSRVQHDLARIDRFFDGAVRMTAIAGFPAFVGFAAIAPIAVPLIFGEQWKDSIIAIQILMLLGLQRTIDGIAAFAILALGRSDLILNLNITYTVIGIVLLPTAAQVSLEMTIVALIACNALLLPVFLYLIHRIAHIDVMRPLAIFPRLAGASALMFILVTAWQAHSPIEMPQIAILASAILIGAASYGVSAVILVRPDLLSVRDVLLRLRN